MFYILTSAFIGLVLGALVGYFMSTTIVVICVIALICLVYFFLRNLPEPGSAEARAEGCAYVGAVFVCGPGFVMFVLSVLIAWFLAPGGIAYDINPNAMWDSIRHFLFR